jgi:DNA polymerase/3'-5' exonuclease PolX
MKATNDDIADMLVRIADLLEAQNANRYRVNAYRRAAKVILDLNQGAADLAVSDDDGRLEELPDIGPGIAGTVREYVATGRSGILERLEGQISPEDLLTTVPGIGEELARRIHVELGIDTLEELELACHDGRLEKVSGIGNRRARSIRDSVGAILNRSTRRRARRIRGFEQTAEGDGDILTTSMPSVAAILEVDKVYRQRAVAGKLKTIAPRRFNPARKPWLPIMHTEKNGWHFTAMFSNTARAHELKKTDDWVVVYFEYDGKEGQCTVVTEQSGPLKNRRVVRGREKDCRAFYDR